MARTGWSTSNFLRYSGAVLTAAPLTMACWANTNITGTPQQLMGLFNSASANQRDQFRLNLNNVQSVVAGCGSSSAFNSSTAGSAASSGVWFHAAAVFQADQSTRSAYFNGGNKGTGGAVSTIPSGINRTSVGLQDNAAASQPFAPAGTGYIAWPAIWNIALSDADIAALGKGADPRLIHPEALIAFWPLIGVNSPENNLMSQAAVLSIIGSLSAADSKPIFRVG